MRATEFTLTGVKQRLRGVGRPVLGLLGYLLVITLAFPDTLYSLHQRWTQWDGAYSHGYILVVVCLLLMIRNLVHCTPATSTSGIWLTVAALLFWVLGFSIQVNVLQQIALPLLLAGFVLVRFGRAGLSRTLIPLLVMYLAIPVWEVLLPVLRQLTADVTGFGIRQLGIPAFIDGFSFTLPYGRVLIAGSCAGLSYLLMGAALASINAQYHRVSLRIAIVEVLLMSTLAILGNWIRVFALVLIAYQSNMTSPLVEDHGSFGWWIFAGVFVLYLSLIHFIPVPARDLPVPSVSAGGGATGRFSKWPVIIGVAVLVLATPLGVRHSAFGTDAQRVLPLSDTMILLDPQELQPKLQLDYRGYDRAELTEWADSDGQSLLVGRLIYEHQRQGKELIADGQQLTQRRTLISGQVALSNGQPVNYEVLEDRQYQLMLSAYLIGNRIVTDPIPAKLAQLRQMLAGRSAVALWFVALDCTRQDCREELADIGRSPLMVEALQALQLYPAE